MNTPSAQIILSPLVAGSTAARGLVCLAAMLGAVACGDTITILECPLGTQPVGDHCEAWGSVDAGGEDGGGDGLPDFRTDDDAAAAPAPDAAPPDAGDADEGPEVGASTDAATTRPSGGEGGTGWPCAKNDDCAGGTCLDWPGGYCTTLDCDSAGCAPGELCLPLTGGNHLCLAACEGDTGCGEHQACKVLPDDNAAWVAACHGVNGDAGSVGATCGTEDAACAGAGTCLQSMPGGYCAVPGCDAGSCPTGSACVKLGGTPTCLRACDVDAHCDGQPGAERRCSTLKAVAGEQVGVCISGASGAPIGDACLNDFECASGTCQVLGEGQCSQSQVPCFAATEAEDCGAAEFCLVTGRNQVGLCTQPCAVSTPCPGATHCVGQPGAPEGWCRPACAGPGADAECPPGNVFSCTFGLPLGDPTGQARYVCAIVPPGSVGDGCDHPEDCGGGTCEPDGTGGGGTCVQDCSDDFYCAFPGICVPDGFPGTCRRACQSTVDCDEDAGLSCLAFGAGFVQACQ